MNMLQRVMDNMRKRIADCIENEGSNLSNIFFFLIEILLATN